MALRHHDEVTRDMALRHLHEVMRDMAPGEGDVKLSSILEKKLCGCADDCAFLAVVSSPFDRVAVGYADASAFLDVVSSPLDRVAVAESLNLDLNRVSKLRDLWEMRLNASKTRTMIVSWSRTMHPQSPLLTLGIIVLLKGSLYLDILGVTFDPTMTFEKHLRFLSGSKGSVS